ncbi:MAG: DUF2971 domain-containing protein [Alistipes sp.]|nr:DUF2971 domain-containing protein [Alistipes sp.]
MMDHPKTKKIITRPDLKRYETTEEFRKHFQSFFPAFRVQQDDPLYIEKMGYVGQLIHLNIPPRLFKYRHVEEYTINNFENDEFICSKPVSFNDPFDCLLYFAIDGLDNDIEKHCENPYPILSKWMSIRQQVKDKNIPWDDLDDQTRFLVSIPDQEFLDFDISKYRNAIRKIHAVAKERLISKIDYFHQYSFIGCLTENNDCPLMWGHYADAHKGFCLEYDLSNNTFVFDNNKPGVKYFKNLFPVIYSEERYCATEFALWDSSQMMGFNDNLLKDALFWNKALTHKSDKWQYENEWRIVINPVHSEYGKMERYHLPLKPTAIYYGYKFEQQPEEYKMKIRNLAKAKGLRQFRMDIEYDEKLYVLTSIPI